MGPSTAYPAAIGLPSPSRFLELWAVLALLIAGASLIVGLRVPHVGLAINRAGTAHVRLTGPEESVANSTRLYFSAPGHAPLAFPAEAIADDADPRVGHDFNVRHWQRMSALATMLGSGNADMRFVGPDGRVRSYRVPTAERTLGTLSVHYWSALLTALAALILGLWVWTVRNSDWPSRQLALMSVGIFVSAIPIAIVGETPLASPFYRWILAVNSFGSMLFGAGLIGVLARFPMPLLPKPLAMTSLVACVAIAAIQVFELVAEGYQLIGLACVVIFAIMLALLTAQVIASRHDAAAWRAALVIATTTGTAVTVVVALVIVPIVLRTTQPISTPLVFPLLLVIHGGLATAVTRAGLIGFERWTWPATRAAARTFLIAAADLLLIALAWWLAGPGAVLVGVAVAIGHLAARALPARKREAAARERERDLVRRITRLALAADTHERQTLWAEALRVAFEPLEIRPAADQGLTRPMIVGQGRSLVIPATRDTAALVLNHAERGRRRFDPGHQDRAGELLALLASTTQARDEYVRGVAEERLRIAQDLHDDVGARLMTSLHRVDPDAMRQDVRDVMTDIRHIVGEMAGDARDLDDLLADIRHETAARLADARIALDWPIGDRTAVVWSTRDARHLTSILRELVSNTIRHADARRVTVTATIDADGFVLAYDDNGRASTPHKGGSGLRNLATRARALGGTINLTGPPGMAVRLVVPGTRSSLESGMAPAVIAT